MPIYSLSLWYGFQTHLSVDTAPVRVPSVCNVSNPKDSSLVLILLDYLTILDIIMTTFLLKHFLKNFMTSYSAFATLATT